MKVGEIRPSVHQQLKELKEENHRLKQQLAATTQEIYGWVSIREYIKFELSKNEEIGTKGVYDITQGISNILRRSFKIRNISELSYKDYPKAKEFTNYVINFINDNNNN